MRCYKKAGDHITDKIDIKSLNLQELTQLLIDMGQPKFRAIQIFKWLQSGIDSFDEMTNIPIDLRRKLESMCYIATVRALRRFVSQIDGTVKFVYELYDGELIESVLMKYKHGYTVCISTQVGCRMGCKFCASGLYGLTRNLTASEMLSQITYAQRDNGIRISNIVMMGMGEPLDNFENSVRFLKLASDENGLNIGLRHISLSTSGVVSGIKRLKEYNLPITLSISLHAPNDEIRSSIMRVNKKWNIKELLSACREYQRVTTRRISFEYALIDGVNDTEYHASLLAKRAKAVCAHVNLIPLNHVEERQFAPSTAGHMKAFIKILEDEGVNVTVRRKLGGDVDASCGQLRRKAMQEKGGNP